MSQHQGAARRQLEQFRKTVYAHYQKNRRSLPWRRTADPYRILVSEVMLQQTQVERVIGAYGRFLQAFPTLGSLARAPLEKVVIRWQGLGYNRRAVFLKKLAEAVVSRHGGKVPAQVEALDALPGIGRDTACAIAAFAFNQPVAFIETNIRSVFIHHFFKNSERVADSQILPLVARSLDRAAPRRWYSALMDYGASLKKQHPNPGRKSAHYARQSRFAGSNRYYRGAIVRLLAKKQRVRQSALAGQFDIDSVRIRTIIEGMVREGLIKKRGDLLRL